jgi:cytoskeletal protein RodZ
MKKTILSVIALLGFGLLMQAQTTTPAKTSKPDKVSTVAKTTDQKVKSTTAAVKKDAATQTTNAKDAAKTSAIAVKTTTGPTKKDGTADMRYKANKEKPAGPTKKDGTPDKRYKANKSK